MHSFAIDQRLKSMASSNRHWPSMFRSNPAACDSQQQQLPADMSKNSSSPSSLLSSPGSSKPSLISSGIEEGARNPEPKPRWNPRPEQIRILEGIFNAGVVNPPRDEIRRIRLQLQEYGQVGDANVFYWFQNRKSRTKSKLRAPAGAYLQPAATRGPAAVLQARACASPPPQTAEAAPAPPLTPPRRLFATSPLAPTSSSSSSSDRSSGSSKSVMKLAALASTEAVASQGIMLPPSMAINLSSPTPSPALSARQLYYHHSHPIPTPTAPLRELITFPGPPPHLPQWPQSQYLPATELGGVLGSHAHTTPATYPAAVSPGALLGLCNDALGQEDIIDMSCSKGPGQYFNNDTCTADQPSHKTDAVSAVIREDETARLGLLHYGFDVTAAAAPVYAAVSAASDVYTAILPCAAPSNVATSSAELTDQLQVFDLPGLLDAGLIGGAAPPPTATVVVAVAARPDAVRYYSVPATMHLDVKLFGEAAVLLGHTGEQVLVDESGVTAEPLQQGAVYYVLVNN